MENHPVPEWARLLPENEFISYLPSYEGGKYFSLFDKRCFPCAETGDITYYVYDPVKHGADPKKKYPVLLWLHGYSNALNGEFCICNCGGELFASPKYQSEMGGAFVVVPLANEKRVGDEIEGSWSDKYVAPVKGILDEVCSAAGAGKCFAMGGSSGGRFTWRLAENYPDAFAGIIPISTGYIPSSEKLETFAQNGMSVLFTCGKHDELVDFDKDIAPRVKELEELGVLCYFPEWVKNGDGGVASLFYGFEMGQHCVINQVQANLMFDDGTPYDERLSGGVTGWIKKVCD